MKSNLPLLALFFMFSVSLAQAQEPNVNLVFETQNSNGETAILNNFSMFGTRQEVEQAELDEDGIFSFSIYIEKPERFNIFIKGLGGFNLFLVPNKDYRFYVDYEKTSLDITDENTNDLINVFFCKFSSFTKGLLYKGKPAIDLKGEDKIAFFAMEEEKSKLFLNEFIKKYQPNSDDQYFIENYVRFSQLAYRFNQIMFGEYNGFKETIKSKEVIKSFQAVTFDPNFLELSPEDYSGVLIQYYYFKALQSYSEEYGINDWEEMNQEAYLGTIENILEYDIPIEFREFLLAYVINEEIQSPQTFNHLSEILETNYPNSMYLPFLNSAFDKAHQLNGKFAPEIIGVDIKGDTVSLSSLKGKVVYIDFWATWCGPCIAEFPNSIALKKKLEGRSDIVFLYVSVDEEEDKWINFLSKKPELTGLHINGRANYENGFDKSYRMEGVPHYSLVNKEGIMVEVNAPRPSDERTLPLILEQL